MLKFIDSRSARRGALDSDLKGSFPSHAPVLTSTVFLGEGMEWGDMSCLSCNKEKPLIKTTRYYLGLTREKQVVKSMNPGLRKKYKEHIKASPNNTIHHTTRLEPANEPVKRQLNSVVQSYNHNIKQSWPHLLSGRLCEALGVSSPACPYTTWITYSC